MDTQPTGLQTAHWHAWPHRVRYQETDRMGVVFHAYYLSWCEVGRTEMIRHYGLSYRSLEEHGLYLPLTSADLKFKQAAGYDDCVVIFTKAKMTSPLRLEFLAEIRKVNEFTGGIPETGERVLYEEPYGELLVQVATTHAWLDRDWRPVRLDRFAPATYRLLQSFCDVSEPAR